MRVAYFADDGTEFESERECRQYERNLSDLLYELQNGVHAYDEDGDVIEFDVDDLEYNFEQVTFIKFDNGRALDLFVQKANDFGMPCFRHNIDRPLVVGERYYYSYGEDCWCCVEDKLKDIDIIIQVFDEQ